MSTIFEHSKRSYCSCANSEHTGFFISGLGNEPQAASVSSQVHVPRTTKTSEDNFTEPLAPDSTMSRSYRTIPKPPPILALPPETRFHVYHHLRSRPIELKLYPTKRVPCCNVHDNPLLGVCSILRTEFLSHLLNLTTICLSHNVRLEARKKPLPLPKWHMFAIQHITLTLGHLTQPMNFAIFPHLHSLTLEWKLLLLSLLDLPAQTPKKGDRNNVSGQEITTGQSVRDAGFEEAVVRLATSVVKSAPEAWIRKLVCQKERSFNLRLSALVKYIGASYSSGSSTVVVDVDHGRLVSTTSTESLMIHSQMRTMERGAMTL